MAVSGRVSSSTERVLEAAKGWVSWWMLVDGFVSAELVKDGSCCSRGCSSSGISDMTNVRLSSPHQCDG